ncbi:F0F1 ATP synthase subunit B [Patescibacteria group bacterium]|nr:F0F1 ATP synthase subunit B [Patescibacteria group bacterium]
MEIIKNFGLDPILLGAQIVNFLIIFYVLKRFLYKPVLSVLRKREQEIKDGLKQAEEGKKALENALQTEKEILKKAQNQAQKILEDAKLQALETSRQTQENARKRAEEMLSNAKDKIDQDIRDAEKRLTVYVSELAINLLEKSTKVLFSGKEQGEIIKTALKNFRKQAN